MLLLFVCLGAAVGAPARYLTDRFVQSRHDTVFPWGTFTVNVLGSLLLGGLFGASTQLPLPPEVVVGVGVGFCGTYSTYSTFGYETVRLAEDGARLIALLSVVTSLAAGLAAAALGFAAGQAL